MKRIQILDCTLRDGGYLIDSQFGNTSIKGIIQGLTESGIDVIECGFLKNEPHVAGSTVFNNAAQLRPFMPKDRKQASYVCLADYSRYSIDYLEDYDGTSIDGVRACFFLRISRNIKDTSHKIRIKRPYFAASAADGKPGIASAGNGAYRLTGYARSHHEERYPRKGTFSTPHA